MEEQSFRIMELSNLKCSSSSFCAEEERLERFVTKWDHILAGLHENRLRHICSVKRLDTLIV